MPHPPHDELNTSSALAPCRHPITFPTQPAGLQRTNTIYTNENTWHAA